MVAKYIVVSVINDLITDQRVHKTCTTLNAMGFCVVLVGRKLPSSMPIKPRIYNTKRFTFLVNKGFLFYAMYNIRLFFYLLFSKATVLVSNDLDTLPANYLVSVLRKIPLVYDSHEYFTEVPELIDRPKVKKIWEKIESWILPHVKYAFTVSSSIADVYNKKYKVEFKVICNFPEYKEQKSTSAKKLNNTILYQGALNVGRGIENAIEAMQYVENATLQIIGDGDISKKLELLAIEKKVINKVQFIGKIPFDKLNEYTRNASIGLSVEEDRGLNYQYALPNKLFDYIHAGIPVIVSPLKEMEKIVSEFDLGVVLKENTPQEIAKTIIEMLSNTEKLNHWKANAEKAAQKLCWQNEELKLKTIFETFS
jgi:glycosyltransferase involved in cell wall biosynthesis